mmetsp:Transcript_56330/g.134438  ORF Transcript_56330/g.134438 Transcript_56330/m.134438 type:complete len:1649 (+) Transcript_56330:89-5035(+)|eukprot:CAMPEP_0181425818 /NCGR_PEP_ID=MMETSP1110-20121109/15351_1 /TAXON_ID=174948 /ORGANISM="Symbiodinium sp., Strain CCMP421" /LENGTH=1648 /DNA_ID=CAMNT_0023549009 /DNA_START=76 /DNA_END=5022 /DNA_ORIENTATION=+
MSSTVMPVLLSLCFALAFLAFTFLQETDVSAEMFQAAGARFLNAPWRQYPKSVIYDVHGPRDVHLWLENVFINQLYMERAENGNDEAYCTKSNPCRLGEGNANLDSECAGSLVAGEGNCPSHMGSRKGCCQQCVGAACPMHVYETKDRNLTANTSVLDLSANCADTIPAWLSFLTGWKKPALLEEDDPVNISFCPERVGKPAARGLMVGRFNQALMGRISLKRRKMVQSTSPVYSNAYGKVMAAWRTNAYSNNPSEEDTSSFGNIKRYHYKQDAGFRRAGAFEEILDFEAPKKVNMRKITSMQREGWFNLQQGSLVVEIMLWNGNVELLSHIAFIFEHGFSGKSKVSVSVSSLAFNVHDFGVVSTYFRLTIYVVIVVCFVFFFRAQLEDMSADYKAYFSEPMGYIHLALFFLCAYVIGSYLAIVLSYPFLNFRLPMAVTEFQDIAELTMNNQDLKVAISVTTCLLFLQAVAECCSILPQLRLLVDSVGRMSNYLVTFFAIFFVMIFGFSLAGMFEFGQKLNQFNNISHSILTVVEMIRGKANYQGIVDADPQFGDAYFLFFHFFFLIFAQYLLTILMTGYLKERKRLAESEQVETPLRRILRSVKSALQHASANIRSRLLSLQQIFFGAGGGAASKTVDYEQVARLRDKRATQPIIRNVVYEKRPGSDQDDLDISEDVFLRASEPFYPDGMMHYYVDGTATDGFAQDYKVQGFRLVGIFSKGNYDREKFRSQEHFENKYKRSPQEILKEISNGDSLPVRLEFQGRVKPFSCECITLAFFCCIFLIFTLQVSRVPDSFSLAQIHRLAIAGPEWKEYRPTRIVDFRNVTLAPGSFNSWMHKAIFEGEMGCVGKIDDNRNCILSNENQDGSGFVRQNWQLYIESSSPELQLKLSALPELAEQSLSFAPPASTEGMGMSFGPKQTAAVDVDVRLRTWNVGVMPKNQVRIILQIPCFQPVTNTRFNADYQYKLDPKMKDCANQDCMGEIISQQQTCHTFEGELRNVSYMTGAYSGIDHRYTSIGAKGIVLGLGGTPQEAETVWNILKRDQLSPVSMVLEYVTYNGNMDMFTHTRVKFQLQGTGLLTRQIELVVFPLNVFNMGLTSFAAEKTATNRALFVIYLIAALLFLCLVLRDLFIQLKLTSLERAWYIFLYDFFVEDMWNAVDVLCIVVNAFVIHSIFSYLLIDGVFNLRDGFQSWTLDFSFPDTATVDTVDPFTEFGRAADLYSSFETLSALSGLFLLLRFAKYFRCVASLRLVLATLGAALHELVNISAVMIIVLLAVVLMMHNRFGMIFPRYGTLTSSSQSMFFFLTGYFDTADLYEFSPLFLLMVMVFFQVAFLLILNLFVSAIIFRWKDTRRDAEEFSISGFFRLMKEHLNIFKPNKGGSRAEEDRSLQKLDAEFWSKMGILRHLERLDESGKIVPVESEKVREDEVSKEENSEDEGEQRDDLERFVTIFKKAHMEIASQMTRDVGEVEDEGSLEKLVLVAFDDSQETLGIIEEPQNRNTMEYISTKMNQELEHAERPAQEIWLDALITVLEEAQALRKLQKLFIPMPMIQPKKAHEWQLFHQKKIRMERRLNSFLRWLQEEARVQHYQYVREMAVSKERVLKQQSLVLMDYLETLDKQIEKLQQEIQRLEKKNSSMRAHVSPLL